VRCCVCVAGWHYRPDLYDALLQLRVDKVVINHRPPGFLKNIEAYDSIKDYVYTFPNRGLDFGAYHQFNESFDRRRYDFVVYCHDDIILKSASFAEVLEERFSDPGVAVVGNGYNGKDAEFAYKKYRRRMLWEDADDAIVRTVRGSFFAARTSVFDRIGNFPVDWRASSVNMRRGNNSLRNFAHLVCKALGRESIQHLDSERWLDTQYLTELRRGERVGSVEAQR
jgi:hypothetical protein